MKTDFEIGIKIGKLTVLSKNNKTTKYGCYWNCKCDCGTECIIVASRLSAAHKNQNNISCGCFLKRKIEYGLATKKILFKTYQRSAKDRDLLFDISFDRFVELTSSNCNYCNIKPFSIIKNKTKNKNGDYIYNGIDRVNNALGYIESNCVPCCKICNAAKGEMTLGEFKDYASRLWQNIYKPILPDTIHFAKNEFKDMKISEIANNQKGRDWLLREYMALGNCPTKQAIGKELIKYDDIKFYIKV